MLVNVGWYYAHQYVTCLNSSVSENKVDQQLPLLVKLRIPASCVALTTELIACSWLLVFCDVSIPCLTMETWMHEISNNGRRGNRGRGKERIDRWRTYYKHELSLKPAVCSVAGVVSFVTGRFQENELSEADSPECMDCTWLFVTMCLLCDAVRQQFLEMSGLWPYNFPKGIGEQCYSCRLGFIQDLSWEGNSLTGNHAHPFAGFTTIKRNISMIASFSWPCEQVPLECTIL